MGKFSELKVWEISKRLAVDIYKFTNEGLISKDFGLKDQLRRAAVSIPSNIAEGDELNTDKQSIHYFYIARGSVAELKTQLIIASEIGYVQKERFEIFIDQCNEISAMLTKLIQHRSK
jgi:four helix bundle protein